MMLLNRHPSKHLAPYCDKQLDEPTRRVVDAHLAACARCREEVDEIRFAAGLVRQLASVSAPSSVWMSIDRALRTSEVTGVPGSEVRAGFAVPGWRWALVPFVVALAAGTGYWYANRPAAASWEVNRLDATGVTERLAAGDLIETNQSSRARIRVGDIGTVDVEPDTRVRLGTMRPSEYRLALDRGTISARIVAPPRFFFVETPASTVVDLGCAYTMHVADDGAGELRMTEGWASLEWGGRESLIPAGAHCRTRPGVGPGTPYFEDAPLALQDALSAFDFAGGGSAALDVIVAQSRVRDTLTLWHLLSRVEPHERSRVYDRIVELTPLPAGVTLDKALQLDAETLKRWREELAWTW